MRQLAGREPVQEVAGGSLRRGNHLAFEVEVETDQKRSFERRAPCSSRRMIRRRIAKRASGRRADAVDAPVPSSAANWARVSQLSWGAWVLSRVVRVGSGVAWFRRWDSDEPQCREILRSGGVRSLLYLEDPDHNIRRLFIDSRGCFAKSECLSLPGASVAAILMASSVTYASRFRTGRSSSCRSPKAR